MKEKIIIFIIGLLLGAVISTGAFYVYTTTANKCDNSTNQTMQMPSGNPPQMPNGDNNSNSSNNNGQPPEMPSGENNSNNNGQPPQQNNNNSNNNT